MAVKSEQYGIIHGYATCEQCDWNDAIRMDEPNRMQKLRNRIHSHVNKTGHTVNLETGSAIKYMRG